MLPRILKYRVVKYIVSSDQAPLILEIELGTQ